MSDSKSKSNACQKCGEVYVVNTLARCCELKHEGRVFVRDPRQEPRNKRDRKKSDEDK